MNLPRPQGNAWLTAEDALEWVSERTGRPWRMPELLALHLPASVWLDPRGGSDALLDAMQLRGRPEGIRCPIHFHGDLVRLAHELSEVTVTLTERPDGLAVRFDPPPRLPLSAIRYELRKLEERFPQGVPSGHADAAATTPALLQQQITPSSQGADSVRVVSSARPGRTPDALAPLIEQALLECGPGAAVATVYAKLEAWASAGGHLPLSQALPGRLLWNDRLVERELTRRLLGDRMRRAQRRVAARSNAKPRVAAKP